MAFDQNNESEDRFFEAPKVLILNFLLQKYKDQKEVDHLNLLKFALKEVRILFLFLIFIDTTIQDEFHLTFLGNTSKRSQLY